ncbi:GTPase domain-containing protein [Mameliella sp.]|uniref:GTPase domain-containing protein n=1 Tax=Mameliella sp. TaxID=1924940 RepID=UPI003B50DE2D
MDGGAGAVGIKFGIEVLKRTLPSGLAWVKTYVKGVNLLILGPSNSGKTTFSDYLIYGIFNPESQHITTVEETPSPTFEIKLGKGEALKLNVRKSLDEPGQVGPMEHANLVKLRKPHAILLVLDVSQPIEENKKWLLEFCEHFERVLQETGPLKKKIKSIIVVLNKRDKVANSAHYSSRSKAVRKILTSSLGGVLGAHRAKAIPVLPCVSVLSDGHGTAQIDAVISTFAKQVR